MPKHACVLCHTGFCMRARCMALATHAMTWYKFGPKLGSSNISCGYGNWSWKSFLMNFASQYERASPHRCTSCFLVTHQKSGSSLHTKHMQFHNSTEQYVR